MLFQNEIDELQLLVNYVKKNPNLIQASGGNASIKCNSKVMRIKASGHKIVDINKPDGFIDVNYKEITDFLNVCNSKSIEKGDNFSCQSHLDPKVSIEVHFHAILKRVVLHTHPIGLNSILASKDASKIIKQLTNSINYIPYIKPGFFLGLEVLKLLNNGKEKYQDNCLVFIFKIMV